MGLMYHKDAIKPPLLECGFYTCTTSISPGFHSLKFTHILPPACPLSLSVPIIFAALSMFVAEMVNNLLYDF